MRIKRILISVICGVIMYWVVFLPGRNIVVGLACGAVGGVCFYWLTRTRGKESLTVTLSADGERDAFFRQGHDDLRDINKCLERIGAEPIKTAVGELMGLASDIMGTMKKKPECFDQARPFLAHYLPVLKKVLLRYAETERFASPETTRYTEKLTVFLTDAQAAFKAQRQRLHDGDLQDAAAEMDAMKAAWQLQGLLDEKPFK